MTSAHNSNNSHRLGSLVVFGLFSAAYVMSYFYRSANAVIAPDLSREMSLGAAQLGLMTSLFYAAFASVQIPLGIALDRFGPRWVTSSLMLIGAGGSFMFAGATTFGDLAIGRAVIGIGMAGVSHGFAEDIQRVVFCRTVFNSIRAADRHWLYGGAVGGDTDGGGKQLFRLAQYFPGWSSVDFAHRHRHHGFHTQYAARRTVDHGRQHTGQRARSFRR